MMAHHDSEITDVLVVLDGQGPTSVEVSLPLLQRAGLQVSDVNHDEGVVEGSIESDKVSELKNVPGVCYVRSVFTYVADFPSGDPRDRDGPEESTESD